VFRQYDGVAPKSFLRLFRPEKERKLNGRLVRPDARFALPVFRVQLDSLSDYEADSLSDYEAKVLAELSSKEQNINETQSRFGVQIDGPGATGGQGAA